MEKMLQLHFVYRNLGELVIVTHVILLNIISSW